jgi:hypothetical protein
MSNFSAAEIQLRIDAVKKTRKLWKGQSGYCRILDLDIFALELALEYVTDPAGLNNRIFIETVEKGTCQNVP